MKIKVTKEHIELGIPGDCYSCPIALALHEFGFSHIEVDHHWAHIGDGIWWSVYKLPVAARRFVKTFDAEGTAEPFEFDIDINVPNPSHKDV